MESLSFFMNIFISDFETFIGIGQKRFLNEGQKLK